MVDQGLAVLGREDYKKDESPEIMPPTTNKPVASRTKDGNSTRMKGARYYHNRHLFSAEGNEYTPIPADIPQKLRVHCS
jgi:hypothetical protein